MEGEAVQALADAADALVEMERAAPGSCHQLLAHLFSKVAG